jgi:hypothetical protein
VDVAAIVAFFRSEFEAEERAGFPRLSLVPDTYVRRFLRYFRDLPGSDAELLKSAISKVASRSFEPAEHPIQLTDAERLSLDQLGNAKVQFAGWQFISLKLLKMGMQVPDDVRHWLDGITVCKAPELRKLVKHAFATRFGFEAKKMGGGYWVYHRPDGICPFEVEIDYGGRWGQQLRYAVRFGKPTRESQPKRLLFEGVLGAGLGWWDFITDSTADRDIALLVDLVEYAANIPVRLAQAAGGSTDMTK